MLYPYPLGMKNAYFKNSMDAKSLIKKLSNSRMVYQNPLYWKISITHLLCFHKALCFFCQFNMLEWFIRIPYCVFKFPYSWEHYQFAENVPNPGGWLFSIGDFDKPFAIYFTPHSPDKIRKCSQSLWKSRFIPFWSFPSSFYQDNPHGTPYFTSELKFGSKSNNLCGCWIRIWHFVFLSLISPKTRWRDNKTDMVNEINHIVPTLYLHPFFISNWRKNRKPFICLTFFETLC